MPAKAGIQVPIRVRCKKTWIPACAAMTRLSFTPLSRNCDLLDWASG